MMNLFGFIGKADLPSLHLMASHTKSLQAFDSGVLVNHNKFIPGQRGSLLKTLIGILGKEGTFNYEWDETFNKLHVVLIDHKGGILFRGAKAEPLYVQDVRPTGERVWFFDNITEWRKIIDDYHLPKTDFIEISEGSIWQLTPTQDKWEIRKLKVDQ